MKLLRTLTLHRFDINILTVFTGIIVTALTGSILVYVLEPETFTRFSQAVWWAFVTITTVGYGDIVPENGVTHIIAVIVMFAGISFVSLFTATISSTFVARQIREGKGLETIKWGGHIIVCGWNSNTMNLVESIEMLSQETQKVRVVLINNLPEEEINNVLYKSKDIELHYVRGDFTKEVTLERANVAAARSVIIVPNEAEPGDPDEKTVLATLSIKSMNPNVPVIAFINQVENRSHLRRAQADEIYVRDEFSGYILASHVLMPGIPQAYYQLMNNMIHPTMIRRPVTRDYIGKTYKEYFEMIRRTEKAMVLGFIREAENISFSDFLSSDTSQLDAFIERKLRNAGHSLREKDRIDINLNPDDDYSIREGDIALLIH